MANNPKALYTSPTLHTFSVSKQNPRVQFLHSCVHHNNFYVHDISMAINPWLTPCLLPMPYRRCPLVVPVCGGQIQLASCKNSMPGPCSWGERWATQQSSFASWCLGCWPEVSRRQYQMPHHRYPVAAGREWRGDTSFIRSAVSVDLTLQRPIQVSFPGSDTMDDRVTKVFPNLRHLDRSSWATPSSSPRIYRIWQHPIGSNLSRALAAREDGHDTWPKGSRGRRRRRRRRRWACAAAASREWRGGGFLWSGF